MLTLHPMADLCLSIVQHNSCLMKLVNGDYTCIYQCVYIYIFAHLEVDARAYSERLKLILYRRWKLMWSNF